MDANEVKQSLSENDIFTLLQELGAQPKLKGSNIICKTICHNGHSHKLTYYSNSHSFYCFTECGHMDLYGLIGKIKGLTFLSHLNLFVRDLDYHTEIQNMALIKWICLF